ncbi:MAG: hypothetical protein ACHQNE_07310, partial [Candidatus Kapaibacterium sp.]
MPLNTISLAKYSRARVCASLTVPFFSPFSPLCLFEINSMNFRDTFNFHFRHSSGNWRFLFFELSFNESQQVREKQIC